MRIGLGAFLLMTGAAGTMVAQVTLPAGTPLVASVPQHLSLKVGELVDAELRYAVYVDDALLLPAGTHLVGRITGLTDNRPQRLQSRLRGDFTPFSKPVVQFDRLVLQDGTAVELQTSVAEQGAPIFRLVAPPPRKGGFFRQEFETGKQMVGERVAVVTGPDKKDRLVQFLYTQLPYHPQRIEQGTAWTVETTAPVVVPRVSAEASVPAGTLVAAKTLEVQEESKEQPTWLVNASLDEPLTSKTARVGQTVHATVAEPVLNPDQTVAVPQGAVLEGAVTQARPARQFGRAGVLRFDFRQITLPSGRTETVQASLAGIDSEGDAKLAMDSEGKVKPKPQDKLAVPLLLFALAARPLDQDGHDGQFGKDAVASNSLGLAGFLVGTAAQAPYLAAGIGYYGTALSIYNRWIKRGADIEFRKDTRVVVQTTVRKATVLKAAATK